MCHVEHALNQGWAIFLTGGATLGSESQKRGQGRAGWMESFGESSHRMEKYFIGYVENMAF